MSTSLIVLLVVAAIALELFLARLVMRDAKTKGLNPTLWGTVVFFTTFIGYFCYLAVSRSKKA